MNDEIVSIYAQGAVLKHQYLKEMDDVDQGHMLITFANNTLADIEISRNANDIYDVRTESAYQLKEEAKQAGYKSLLSIPIESGSFPCKSSKKKFNCDCELSFFPVMFKYFK